MEGKARFIFPILATGIVVFFVSCVVTFSNIGLCADFVTRWLSAFFIGWPVSESTRPSILAAGLRNNRISPISGPV